MSGHWSRLEFEMPDAPSGIWRDLYWVNTGPEPMDLERAHLRVEPPAAFRQLRVYRANGDLLANESWDPSRTRGIRVQPANTVVQVGEQLNIRAMAWWPDPVAVTAVLTWKV